MPGILRKLLRRSIHAVAPVFFLCLSAQNADATPKDLDIDYYIQTHGQIDPVELPEIYKVFQKIVGVADKSNLYWPELIVVNDKKRASVLALKEGHILLTKKAIDMVYKDVDQRHGDTRLAFILGHELSHIAQNDFLNDEIARSLSGATFNDKPLTDASLNTTHQMKEARADKQGFLYAATAGYPVDVLLGNGSTQEDFFNYWIKQTRGGSSAHHPTAEQRTAFLRQDLTKMLHALDYFYYGERLSHFGNYEQAVELYQAFQKIFPSKEVLNNLGYGYIKMAMARMDPTIAYHYWMPVVADNESILSALRARALKNTRNSRARSHSAEIRRLLNRAVRYLNQAVEKDPNHISAYTNLAVAHFFLANDPSLFNQHISLASAASEAAHTRSPENMDIKILRALILHKANISNNIFEDILKCITDEVHISSDRLSAIYNVAQLLPQDSPQKALYMQKALSAIEKLPKPIQYALCESKRISNEKLCFAIKTPNYASSTDKSLPIELGRDLIFLPFTKQELRTYRWQEKALTSNAVTYTGELTGTKYELLMIDDILTMIVVRDEQPISTDTLLHKQGEPASASSTDGRKLLSYRNFTALSEYGNIRERWYAQQK